jgi:hypothetical protein
MRHSTQYIALSLLAAAFAGCSSNDTGSNTGTDGYNPDLPGALAKYNSALLPLTNTCQTTGSPATAITYKLEPKEILVLSVRSLDKAILANGTPCTYTPTATTSVPHPAATPVTNDKLKTLTITGDTTPGATTNTSLTPEAVILDMRNGIMAPAGSPGGTAITLNGSALAQGDEIAVLGTSGTDNWSCKNVGGKDGIYITGKTSPDIAPTASTSTPNHFTFDLNSGDDTFDQTNCLTSMAVYGSAGKDTITVGSLATTTKDLFSGGTDNLGKAESIDTVIFPIDNPSAKPPVIGRQRGVTVVLDTLAGTSTSGDGNGSIEQDKFLNDIEVVYGTPFNDVLVAGNLMTGTSTPPNIYTAYTLYGLDGDDKFSSSENFGTNFVGGNGTDTVDYHLRSRAINVTMDGTATAVHNDGEMLPAASSTGATLDNVGSDIENLIGTDAATTTPNGTDDVISGNGSNNVIKPGNGNDIVLGLGGDDIMLSGWADGTDAIDGNDVFQGGAGTDLVDYSSRAAGTSTGVVVNLSCTFASATSTSANNPTCASGWAGGTAATSTAVAATSTETDYIGADVENAVGTVAADTIKGGANTNSIWSMGGADYILGGTYIETLDANKYTAVLLTPNGYRCTYNGACIVKSSATSTPLAGANFPADCDCTTSAGFLCDGSGACYEPATGATILAAGTSSTGILCDCGVDAVYGPTAIMGICDPSIGLSVDKTTDISGSSTIPLTDFTGCKAGTYDRGTCAWDTSQPSFTIINCNNVGLDVATCTGGTSTAPSNFISCLLTQT